MALSVMWGIVWDVKGSLGVFVGCKGDLREYLKGLVLRMINS